MKKLFILFLSFVSIPLFCQEKDTLLALPAAPNVINENTIFDGNTEVEAQYFEGIAALKNFFAKYIKYPETAINKGTEGLFLIKFVVEKDGTISNPTIIDDIGDGCGEEAIRVIKLTFGKWKAAQVNGMPLRSVYRFPVFFRIP
ncbi:energy transducer TonB [Apibacter adventoris]|uniref:energy transducer TonB n=1 Tax=Apibacter adventoris TaxID=1679466 RepID=UPI000CF74691|nr:energy transducer TonB [Apibacter adventoris]PQL95167.1 hypothetical protein C4S76_02995 [Apibacter adventoris]